MSNLINPRFKDLIIKDFLIVLLALCVVIYPMSPIVEMWGQIVLLAVLYGILNDLRACYVCPEYFTYGHRYGGDRLVTTLDTIPNALVWGVVATVKLAAGAGAIFCLIVSPDYFHQHMPTILKFLMVVLVSGEIASYLVQSLISKNLIEVIFYGVPLELKSRWIATGIRNMIGYNVIILGGILLGASGGHPHGE